MGHIKVTIGQRYGRLVTNGIIRKTSGGARVWACRCDCGNVCTVRASHLTSGASKSCGCLRTDVLIKNGKKGLQKAHDARRLNYTIKVYTKFAEHFGWVPWGLVKELDQKLWLEFTKNLYFRNRPDGLKE